MLKNLKLTPGEIDYLKSKKIGLVLSGGASRGYAEAGAMSVFEKHSIPFTAVVGTSVGSLIGTCVAAGKSVSLLLDEFIEHKPFTWRDISLFNHSGLLNADHIVERILSVLEVNSFSDLATTLKVTSTNLNTGKEKIFSKGKLLPALASSIAFPGVISPKKIGKHYFADGGVTNPIPVHLLPSNIDLVIIIDVTGKIKSLEEIASTVMLLRNVYEIMLHHISNREIAKVLQTHDAILIQPPVASFALFNFSNGNAKQMIRAGDTTARKALKQELNV